MILYLTIVSIANIALGFWLAFYLGYARFGGVDADGLIRSGARQAQQDRQESSESQFEWDARPAETSESGNHAAGLAAATSYGDEAVPQAEPAVAEAAIDRNLLAGIEQFRNQLAQIKGQVEVNVPAGAGAGG